MQQEKDLQKPVTISMPDSLRESLERKAKEQERSLSNYIRLILVKHS
jgi:hypothetical protein